MVLGVNSQDGQDLARPQADADINHPDEPITEGGRDQGSAPQPVRRIAADDSQSCDPIDDRLRTRGFAQARPLSEELEHSRHDTKADPHLSKESQIQPHQIDFVRHDQPVGLGFVALQTLLRLLVGVLGAVALLLDPCKFFAQIAILLGPLRRFPFPLLAAVSEFGLLTHHAPSCHIPSSQTMGG